ncbi:MULTISPECIES: hypothetical protein [Streptomyces]|uniref:hypothetical protein n=1 Tax=Streptomyces TaxID=1883 RepID=UPI0035F3AEC4
MSLGEITTTDLNSWQHRVVKELLALVDSGLKAQRHPLDWTVTSSGHLRGVVGKADRLSENDRRAVFQEWVRVPDAEPLRESRRFEGGTWITATFKRSTNRGDVKGFIQVEFDAPEDQDGGRD